MAEKERDFVHAGGSDRAASAAILVIALLTILAILALVLERGLLTGSP